MADPAGPDAGNRSSTPIPRSPSSIRHETCRDAARPIGFLADTSVGKQLQAKEIDWFGLIGIIGILIAFGHSILAMSGEETLASLPRGRASADFRRRPLRLLQLFHPIDFVVMISSRNQRVTIPTSQRPNMNRIAQLALNPSSHHRLQILAGAVTAFGSTAFLNRVAEDGVNAEWFLSRTRHFGTSYRLLRLIVGMQFVTSSQQGRRPHPREAYAFGVVVRASWRLSTPGQTQSVLGFTAGTLP